MKRVLTLYVMAALVFITQAATIKNAGKIVPVIRLTKNLELDGKLEESCYKISPVTDFIQKEPEEGKTATEKTCVWVSYDDKNLYISAKLSDSNPSEIDASLARRDSWIDSDWFFIYLDPYHDKKTGYYFAVNPGGSIMDGILFNDSWDDSSWDGIWEAKTKIADKGWNVEIKIPFSQLRFNAAEKMSWGINFQRKIKRKNEQSYFVMVPKKESGFVSHFAILEGINGVKPPQRFELLPYLVQKAQYLRHDSDDPFYKSNQYGTSFGLDMKFGIGSNLNVDATINPDFGQVEVDPAVLNLTAFETFFDEKRPFFIEGNNIFYFGYGGSNNNWGFNFGTPELFYSRRIGRRPQGSIEDDDAYANVPDETRILGAAKLTGKLNESWSVGAVSAVTERTYADVFPENGNTYQTEVEPFTHYGVLRTQKEFSEGRQGLGMMFTSVNRDLRDSTLRENLADQAYTFGIDGWTFLDEEKTWVITGLAAGSYTSGSKEYLQNLQERPYRYMQKPEMEFMKYDKNRTSLAGVYTRFMLNKQKGNFYLNSAVGAVTPGFENNDLGFQWNANKINGHFVMGYRWYETDGLFRKKSLYLANFRSYDFDGHIINNGSMLLSWFQFENYYSIDFNFSYNFETYNTWITRGGPMPKNPHEYWIDLSAASDNRKSFIAELGWSKGEDMIGSNYWGLGLELTWKPSTQVHISLEPSFNKKFEQRQWVTSVEDLTATHTNGNRYVFGVLDQDMISADIRVNWTFTPALSLQLFLQPFFAVGKYSNFKEMSSPGAWDTYVYGVDGGSTVKYDAENEQYNIDPDNGGPAGTFTFDNPDFNYKSLRGNLVLRWEVDPGSVLYFVWTHDKSNFDDPGQFRFGRDFGNLWREESDNIFLVKFSYWFNMAF